MYKIKGKARKPYPEYQQKLQVSEIYGCDVNASKFYKLYLRLCEKEHVVIPEDVMKHSLLDFGKDSFRWVCAIRIKGTSDHNTQTFLSKVTEDSAYIQLPETEAEFALYDNNISIQYSDGADEVFYYAYFTKYAQEALKDKSIDIVNIPIAIFIDNNN